MVLLLATACRERALDPVVEPTKAPAATSVSAGLTTGDRPTVVFLGDSLTAGYGLGEDEAFPALLGAQLEAEGRLVRVVNAGVSGDTTSGGVARIDWLLRQKPAIVVVGLGANDALRGLPLDQLERNLRTIVSKTQETGAEVLLLGMAITPNLGPEYAEGFAAVYPRLAAELDVELVPFLLEGVGGVPELNQADGIHPTPQGQRRVADNIFPYLERLVTMVSDDPT